MKSCNLLLLVGAVGASVAACGDQREQPPTAPDLATAATASTACSFNTIKKQVRDEFTVTADANAVLSLVQAMSGYYPGSPAQATYVGFRILDQIATKGVTEGTPQAGSTLTKSVLACMSVGVPASTLDTLDFTAALSDSGAYSVRGWTGSAASFIAPDARVVTSRPDAKWVLEVPDCADDACSTSQYSWTAFPIGAPTRTGITTLASQASLSDTVKGLFLAYGQPGSGATFASCQGSVCDTLIVGIFDWKTIPTATFDPGVIVGECDTKGFLQHNPAGPKAEILGYVSPFCPGHFVATRESAPRSLAEWAWRLLTPRPAYAAMALSGGAGSKSSNLSPWGVINPVSVNLTFGQKIPKSGDSVGQRLTDTKGQPLQVAALSIGGTAIKGVAFAWIEAINNSGSFVQVCNNWAYTSAEGIAKFPNAYLNKAGGYTLIFKTLGVNFSVQSPPGTPQISAGTAPTSNLFNVKNGTVANDNGCSTGAPDPATGDPTPINSFIYNASAGPNGQTLPPPTKSPPYTLP